MANPYFRFKQFTVEQDKCALKVCTDACILGAVTANRLAATAGIKKVLDIGTGTGLLSLMLAQQFTEAELHAIELDEQAAIQAGENFEHAPWAGRLKVFQGDVRTFSFPFKYDLIISNPPFYEQDLKSGDARKDQAKHAVTLSHESLLQAVARWLQPAGMFVVLLPDARFASFNEIAAENKLTISYLLKIKQTPQHAFFRTAAIFSKTGVPLQEEELTIRDTQNRYTEAFVRLLQPYYLFL